MCIGSMLDVGWGDLIDYLGDDPQHGVHRHLHGVHRRRAGVPVGGARGGADQADHRDQGRAHRRSGRRRRRRTPARSPAPTTCSMRPSAAPACCAWTRSPTCSTWPRCSPSSRGPKGPRLTILTNAGGPGVLATDALIARRRRTGRDLARDHRGVQRRPAGGLEPRQPDRHPRATPARPLRQGAGDRRQGSRTPTACS